LLCIVGEPAPTKYRTIPSKKPGFFLDICNVTNFVAKTRYNAQLEPCPDSSRQTMQPEQEQEILNLRDRQLTPKQNNLAVAYSNKIRGGKAENIEMAIAYYTPYKIV
jgi:hypothetical protein